VAIVYLHFVVMKNAGGMWRDEINSICFAQAPSLEAFLQLQRTVSTHPPTYFVLLRLWIDLMGGGDKALRLFVFLVGIAIPLALWINAAWLRPAPVHGNAGPEAKPSGRSLPLLSLALFGMNADAIWHADKVRGYGFLTIFLVLAVGSVWKLVVSPSRANIALATLAVVGATQFLYQSGFFVLGICVAGAAVAARHRLWKRAALVLAVGGIAAACLVPSIPLALQSNKIHVMDQGFNLPDAITVGMRTLGSSGWLASVVWVALFLLTMAIAVAAQFPAVFRVSPEKRDLALYMAVAIPFALAGYCGFYLVARYGIAARYYIVPLAFVVVFFDAAMLLLPATRWRRWLVLCLSALVAFGSFPRAWANCHVRHTNVDLIAARLNVSAAGNDLIVVMPCMYGATFHRYYNGKAAWISLPEIADFQLQRDDLYKAALAMTNAPASALEKIGHALQLGNKVWFVGQPIFLPEGQLPPSLPPAPFGPRGWFLGPYEEMWAMEAGYFLQNHAVHGQKIMDRAKNVHEDENLPLMLFDGWRSREAAAPVTK